MWLIDLIKSFIIRILSREFLVFVIATVMTYDGVLESKHWLWVSVAFISTRAALKAGGFANLLNTNPNNNSEKK